MKRKPYRASVGSITREQLPGELKGAMEDLKRRFPALGLTLFVFDFGGPGGGIAYVSNAQRADMIRAIREWLHKEATLS